MHSKAGPWMASGLWICMKHKRKMSITCRCPPPHALALCWNSRGNQDVSRYIIIIIAAFPLPKLEYSSIYIDIHMITV